MKLMQVCPPPCVLSVTLLLSNHDHVQIIEVNNVLRQGMEKGVQVVNMMENWGGFIYP